MYSTTPKNRIQFFSPLTGTFYPILRVSVLGSGSSGNATYVAVPGTAVLVDLGFGVRSVERRLQQAGLDDQPISAVLLTHGHSDHTKGVASFVNKHGLPVYMNQATRDETPELQHIDKWKCFDTGSTFSVGNFNVRAFQVPHDSADPVGFRFSADGLKGAVATDLGQLTPGVVKNLSNCDWLVLESNHDVEMLKVGPYPLHLKQRILGHRGHLSNQELSVFLRSQFDGRAAHLFLAHLSRKNNHPQVAWESAFNALRERFVQSSPACKPHLTYQAKPSLVIDF